MPDHGDESVKLQETALSVALANHQLKNREGIRPFTGFCHYCHREVPDPERFCDDFCKADFLYESERRNNQHR